MKEDIIRQILSLIEPSVTSADQDQRDKDSKTVQDQCDPYLQGINIVESMSILGKKRKSHLETRGDAEMFDLSKIREFQNQLEHLIAGEEYDGTKPYQDWVMTFLTEQYPPTHAEKGQ